MTYLTDYTQAQDKKKLLQSMLGQNMQPVQGANPLTTLGKILSSYFLSRGMNSADTGMKTAMQGQEDQRNLELTRALGAYRQDTPHKADLFPGEKPIPGIYDRGTGRDLGAMAESMVSAKTPEIQKLGLSALMTPASATNISSRSEVGGSIVKGIDSRGVPFVKLFDGTVLRGRDALNAIQADEERKKQLAILTAGGKAQAVADVKEKTEPVLAESLADVKLKTSPEIIKQEKLAAGAADKANKAFAQLDTIKGNIFNLEDAKQLVLDGAATGPLMSKLPSLRANAIALDNMQGRLGLDVVGAVTFGALSKGELDLAKSVALPLNLEGPELIKWLDDKISAQSKLADYLERQAVFLSNGGTQAQWIEEAKRLYSKEGQVQDDPLGLFQ